MKTLAEYLVDYVETKMDQQGFEFMSYDKGIRYDVQSIW